MPQQVLKLDPARKTDLRDRLLIFFGEHGAGRTIDITRRLNLTTDYSAAEIKTMIYGMDALGLITRANEGATSGLLWSLTDIGHPVPDCGRQGGQALEPDGEVLPPTRAASTTRGAARYI